MLDFLGNLIVMGDKVVYPVRRGSAMWLVSSTVESTEGKLVCINEQGRRVTIQHPERCITVRNTNAAV